MVKGIGSACGSRHPKEDGSFNPALCVSALYSADRLLPTASAAHSNLRGTLFCQVPCPHLCLPAPFPPASVSPHLSSQPGFHALGSEQSPPHISINTFIYIEYTEVDIWSTDCHKRTGRSDVFHQGNLEGKRLPSFPPRPQKSTLSVGTAGDCLPSGAILFACNSARLEKQPL